MVCDFLAKDLECGVVYEVQWGKNAHPHPTCSYTAVTFTAQHHPGFFVVSLPYMASTLVANDYFLVTCIESKSPELEVVNICHAIKATITPKNLWLLQLAALVAVGSYSLYLILCWRESSGQAPCGGLGGESKDFPTYPCDCYASRCFLLLSSCPR